MFHFQDSMLVDPIEISHLVPFEPLVLLKIQRQLWGALLTKFPRAAIT